MYTGEIQAMWSDIRPKEHGRTRQKTSLTEVQEKLAGVYLVEGYVTVVGPGGSGRSGEVGDTPKWEQQFGVLTIRQGTRQRGS